MSTCHQFELQRYNLALLCIQLIRYKYCCLQNLSVTFLVDKMIEYIYCIAINILIITIVQIHKQIQVDCVVSNTNGFINFWLQSLATRGERHKS